MFSFFFFQAEDGIRDVAVTGVRRVLFRSGWARQELPAPIGVEPQGARERVEGQFRAGTAIALDRKSVV